MHSYRNLFKSQKGLNKKIVEKISDYKNEPSWMKDFRLDALQIFESMPMPDWGVDLSDLDPYDIHCYVNSTKKNWESWSDVPEKIKNKFERLGVPQAERKFLAGVGAQYESEVVYKNIKQEWAKQGVIFVDTSTGLREHEQLFKKYFSTVVLPDDNKFAALNSALWSGGSFLFVPAGVHINLPLHAYFLMNTPQMGQFERTLIIAQPGSSVHYIEGCSAPVYRQSSLHSAVVEVIALPGSTVRYTTIQNWSFNVYNLVTKRAIAYEDSKIEWVDGNFGSRCTMKYPCIVLKGSRANGQIISVSVSGDGQQQDSGGKIIHQAPETRSSVVSKSICKKKGHSTYRGVIFVDKSAVGAHSYVQCDALLLDKTACADAKPRIQVLCKDSDVGHEASVNSLDEEQLFYLQSRGLSKSKSRALIVNGFIDSFVQRLPMEYAVEIGRLINLQFGD